MPMSFGNGSGLQFSSIGITTAVSGITLTTTLYDTANGATTSSSFVPTPLNYVLGGAISDAFVGSGYTSVPTSRLSLTTQLSRAVEINLINDSAGYVELSGPNLSASSALVRVLRGPSTLIGEATISVSNATAYAIKYPASAFNFIDLSPLSGSATYIMQFNPNSASFQLTVNGAKMFVRQL